MSCAGLACPSGPTTSAAASTINVPNNSGNPVYNIPVKVGQPLSNSCERLGTVGSIPTVLNYANFTLVNGVAVGGIPSNGGICNMASFFKSRRGCYHNKNAQGPSNCCEW